MEMPEDQAWLTNSYSLRTTSMETPKGVSRSGRLYQSASRSQMVYSRPTMSIRSQSATWRTSPRPLPPPQAPSLMSSILTSRTPQSSPRLTNSASQGLKRSGSLRSSSMASNGMTLARTNSGFSMKGMERGRSRDRSASPSQY
nr:MAG: movement protein [Bean leafroll virus]UJQ88494.1 MAG: movement protein [Bean leafroll virus]UJQ88499.1 MAG: movement protein [Bean leafroll virus]